MEQKFRSSMLKMLILLIHVHGGKDSTQNYYWQPPVKDGVPDKLFGKAVEINTDMDVLGDGTAFIAPGDFE